MMQTQIKPQNSFLSTARSPALFLKLAGSKTPSLKLASLDVLQQSPTRTNRLSAKAFWNSMLSPMLAKENTENLKSDKVVVIAGGTRGIGQGLAKSFADLGLNVFITGQSDNSVSKAIDAVVAAVPDARIQGRPCDIRRLDNVQQAWDGAVQTYGKVDYWITCAGISKSPLEEGGLKRMVDMRGEGLADVVDVNLTGSLHCAHTVIPAMEDQGFGHFYLFEGFGSDGTIRTGFTPYGATKVAIEYLAKALAQENKEAKSPVKVGSLAPGIVATDLLRNSYDTNSAAWEKDKAIYEILADDVEPVANFLAEQVTKNETSGKKINWLTPQKAARRFVAAAFGRKNISLDS